MHPAGQAGGLEEAAGLFSGPGAPRRSRGPPSRQRSRFENPFDNYPAPGYDLYSSYPEPEDDIIGIYLDDWTEDNEFQNNIIHCEYQHSHPSIPYGFVFEGPNITAKIKYNKTPAANYDLYGLKLIDGTNIVSADEPNFNSYFWPGYGLASGSICVDAGNPDPAYYDVEDPNRTGMALYPAQGTTANDMGAYGGPNPKKY